MGKALQLKGVKTTNLDFKKGLFTLTVEASSGIKPSDIRAVVNKKYGITSVVVEELTGTARKAGDKILFKAKGSGLEYELVKAKDAKPYEALAAKVGEGKTEFRIGGDTAEEKRKEAEGKETTVLTLALASCAVVESK